MIAIFKISVTIDGVNYPAGEHVLDKETSAHWYTKALISDGLAEVIKGDEVEPEAEAEEEAEQLPEQDAEAPKEPARRGRNK